MNIKSLVTKTLKHCQRTSTCEGNLCSNWSCRWLALLVHQELGKSHISIIAYEVKFKPTFHYCASCLQCNTDCNVPGMQNSITQNCKSMCIWLYIILCFVNIFFT
jgi:hypothetical protein